VGVGELVGLSAGKKSLCWVKVKLVGVAEGVGRRVAVGLGVGGSEVAVGEGRWVGVAATMGIGGEGVSAGAQPAKINVKTLAIASTKRNLGDIALAR
jgi:hypothetical protein